MPQERHTSGQDGESGSQKALTLRDRPIPQKGIRPPNLKNHHPLFFKLKIKLPSFPFEFNLLQAILQSPPIIQTGLIIRRICFSRNILRRGSFTSFRTNTRSFHIHTDYPFGCRNGRYSVPHSSCKECRVTSEATSSNVLLVLIIETGVPSKITRPSAVVKCVFGIRPQSTS